MRPLGEVIESTAKPRSMPSNCSHSDTPCPRVTGTTTKCMKSIRSALRDVQVVDAGARHGDSLMIGSMTVT